LGKEGGLYYFLLGISSIFSTNLYKTTKNYHTIATVASSKEISFGRDSVVATQIGIVVPIAQKGKLSLFAPPSHNSVLCPWAKFHAKRDSAQVLNKLLQKV